jgi:hypothetical protein
MKKQFTKGIELIPGLYAFAQSVMPGKTLPEPLTLRRGLRDFGSYVAIVATVTFVFAGAAIAKRLGRTASMVIGLVLLVASFASMFGFYQYSLEGGKADTPFTNAMMIVLWAGMFVLLAVALTFFLTHLEDSSASVDESPSTSRG